MGQKIKIGFPPRETVRFAKAVKAVEINVEEVVEANVDVAAAEATMPADLTMIRGKIADSIGDNVFNASLEWPCFPFRSVCANQLYSS